MVNAIVSQVRDGMENGSLSYDGLKDVIAQLSEIRKDAKVIAENLAKEQKALAKEELAEKNRELAGGLKMGDRIKFYLGKQIVEASVGKQKEGSKTFHIVLDEIPDGSKTADRYVKFEKLVF